jgi:hypothetical protein
MRINLFNNSVDLCFSRRIWSLPIPKLYADDSTIMFSHKDPESISEGLGKELDSCSERLIDNKLSLHIDQPF